MVFNVVRGNKGYMIEDKYVEMVNKLRMLIIEYTK